MWLAWTVDDAATVGWIRGGAQKFIHQVHAIVQIIGIHIADPNVNLAGELSPNRGPVRLQILSQVHVIAPVGSNVLINVARSGIEERLEVTVVAQWTIHRFPNVPLLAGTTMIAECSFVVELLFHRTQNQSVDVTVAGQGSLTQSGFTGPGVGPVIDVNNLEEVKVDRVRTISISPAEVVGIKDLQR